MTEPAARRPLRILVINWQDRLNPQAGGAELHLHEIFRRIRRRGHQVTLLVSGWAEAKRQEEIDGLQVYRTGGRHTLPLSVRSAYRRIRDGGFDIVVEDVNKLPLFTPWWVREPVLALVPHLFGTTAFRQIAWPLAGTVWAAERAMPLAYGQVPFVAISDSTAEDLTRRGFSSERISVSYPGIDHDRFRPDPAVEKFSTPTMVYVGRLKRYKGLDVVFRALRGLAERGVAARMLVTGRGDDQGRLEAVARNEGVGDRVQFLGFVPEDRKIEILRRAWVNVYPSPKEGWGLTNVEAAACGTPTVASDSPGLRESVADGASGFLVPHESSTGWTDRLYRILSDGVLREELGAGAVAHAARFSWVRAADEMEQALLNRYRDGGGRQ
jgi:glycosyltransferase involved in cell wall biosynthesis